MIILMFFCILKRLLTFVIMNLYNFLVLRKLKTCSCGMVWVVIADVRCEMTC